MSLIKPITASILLIILLILVYSGSVAVAQDTAEKVFEACDQAPDSPICEAQTNTDNPVTDIINVAAGIIAILVGIGAVIMLIIGGFSFVTAAGNAEQAATARRRIVYSIVALLVVAVAWAAIALITNRVIQ